jgi:hypothetical protein
MPITALTIENFKGIRDPVRIEFRPITLLFGPNSSGKSTILHALHYAREIFERENTDPDRTISGGGSLNLGGFEHFVYGHDVQRAVRLRFDLDLKAENLVDYLPEDRQAEPYHWEYIPAWHALNRAENGWVQVAVRWSPWLKRPIISEYSVGINGQLFARIEASEDGKNISMSQLSIEHPVVVDDVISAGPEKESMLALLLNDIADELFLQKGDDLEVGLKFQTSALPRWGKPLEFFQGILNFNDDADDQAEESARRFHHILMGLIVAPGQIIRENLARLRYLGPLRTIPVRNHEPVRSPDEALWADGTAAWDLLHTCEDEFVDSVNLWLEGDNHLRSGYRLEAKRYKELDVKSRLMAALTTGRMLDEDDLKEELQGLPTRTRVLLREDETGIELSPQDIGVGISQLLPVVVAALDMKYGTVIVEQPELHIHPAIQVALGDLFISQIRDREVSFLIETHSEHLLLRFLRRIREHYENELPPGIDGLTPDQLSIYNVVNTDEGIKVSELKVSQDGDSEGKWPEGFFEERGKELY